jgi:hypothetical protein
MQSLRQILAVVRLEMGKTFFARRGLWVYLLAFAPVLLYAGRSIYVPRERAQLARISRSHPVSSEALRSIQKGISPEQLTRKLGEPYFRRASHYHAEGGRRVEHSFYKYTDGRSDFLFRFTDNVLTNINRMDPDSLQQVSLIFATIFQFYFLRLAVFFGCAGIFMNLFRGEMLDKSLHFYLLTPMRREVLLAGKYLAGSRKITFLSYKTIREKIAYFLLQRLRKDEKYLQLEINQTQLASQMGVARPSLSRTISEMEAEKLLQWNKNEVVVLDSDRLNKILGRNL